MSTSQNPRVALVTGGSGGIGSATAERLGVDGMAVAVHYAGNKAGAAEVAAKVEKAGGLSILVRGDVADEHDVTAMFDEVEQAFGGIDVVVNTAGIQKLGTLATLDLDEFDRMIRTNVRGAFVVSREAALRVRSGGAIINFSTSVGKLAMPAHAGYAASKVAIDALTPVLAKEMGTRDVTVNAVAPGPTATPLVLAGHDRPFLDRLAAMVPMNRLGQPAETAEVVAFLAGPARWVNGQVIYANGGLD